MTALDKNELMRKTIHSSRQTESELISFLKRSRTRMEINSDVCLRCSCFLFAERKSNISEHWQLQSLLSFDAFCIKRMVTEAVILSHASFCVPLSRTTYKLQHFWSKQAFWRNAIEMQLYITLYICLTHSKRLSLTHHDGSMPDTYIKRPCFSLLAASASVPS